MRLADLIDEDEGGLLESAVRVFARKKVNGRSVLAMKYRCLVGRRKGRLVTNPADCMKPLNVKRKLISKRTFATKGKRMVMKRKRTMKNDAVSRQLKTLNKSRKR